MGWYSVVKTIKGRQYLYRQRTYRAGGKVRTESKYVGAFGGDGSSVGVDITSYDEPEAQLVAITNNTTTHIREPTLRIQKYVRHREDISTEALIKEEELVREKMSWRGLTVDGMKPVRVWQGKKVTTTIKDDGYYVFTPPQGNRIKFKQAYRTMLAMRWLDAEKEGDAENFEELRSLIDMDYRRAKVALSGHLISYFVGWWQGRTGWQYDTAETLGEMIHKGAKETQKKYYKEAGKAEHRKEIEWRKFNRLKDPKKRKRQYRVCKQADEYFRVTSNKHWQAIILRRHFYEGGPYN